MTTFATAAINEYDSNIAQIEEQIHHLQQLLSKQQSARQNVQSIEQMGMSAIGQIAKTLAACNRAGLPQLANSFKEQVMAALNDGSDSSIDTLLSLPAADVSGSAETIVTTPPAPLATDENTDSVSVSDDDILQTIAALDEEHLTDNYLPIYLYRQAFPQLTREQQDQTLYRLCADSRIDLSTLQEVRSYTPEQIKAGIPQDIGGPLFFIIVEDKTLRRSKPIATASVGAAVATDIALMDFNELKTYCLDTLGLSKDDIRKHGKLTRRDTWVKALKDS